ADVGLVAGRRWLVATTEAPGQLTDRPQERQRIVEQRRTLQLQLLQATIAEAVEILLIERAKSRDLVHRLPDARQRRLTQGLRQRLVPRGQRRQGTDALGRLRGDHAALAAEQVVLERPFRVAAPFPG